MNSRKKAPVDYFYYWAEKYRKQMIEEEEIESHDHTKQLIPQLIRIADKGGLINININGLPTKGKSTAGMEIARKLMVRIYKRRFKITDIDRDQQEFLKNMMKPDMKNTIRLIDEWNEAEDSGENSSVIKKTMDTISDVQAQRFVHKIACSPKDSTDKNAWLYLEMFSIDKTRNISTFKIYYKMFVGGYEHKQFIGTAKINVTKTMEAKWYKEYRRRKMEKMEIMTREGIFQPRKLDMAEVIQKVTEEMKPLADMATLINANLIRNVVKAEMRKAKMPMSIIGEELATREAHGILDLYKQYSKICEIMKKQRITLARGGMTEEQYIIQTKKTKGMAKRILKMIQIQEAELEHYKEIKEKYDTIIE